MLSPEELMLPRYKVIARYPHSQFTINLVYTIEECCQILNPNNIAGCLSVFDPLNYPAIFKPLEWHEDRKPEDLPEYVKWKEGAMKTGDLSVLTICGKVVSIDYDRKGDPYFNIEKEGQMPAAKVKPATIEEYLAYTNSKK